MLCIFIVNPAKTKITILMNKKSEYNFVFTYKGQGLDLEDSFVYLKTLFSYNGRSTKNIIRLVDQARNGML